MREGTYQYTVEMTVPLGKRNGNLEISIHKETVVGFLTMFTNTYPIQRGFCKANEISFVGEMKTLLNTFSYVAEGTISQSQVNLIFHTEQGDYPAVGYQTISNSRRM